MDILKPTAITVPGVLNAQPIIALNFATATIGPIILGASFRKKYKNEPFHH